MACQFGQLYIKINCYSYFGRGGIPSADKYQAPLLIGKVDAMKRIILVTVSLATVIAVGVAEGQVRTMFPTSPPKALARAPGGVAMPSPFPPLYVVRDTSPGVRNNFRGVVPIPRTTALPAQSVLTVPAAVAPAPSQQIVVVPVPTETASVSETEASQRESTGYSTPILPKAPNISPSPVAAEQPPGEKNGSESAEITLSQAAPSSASP